MSSFCFVFLLFFFFLRGFSRFKTKQGNSTRWSNFDGARTIPKIFHGHQEICFLARVESGDDDNVAGSGMRFAQFEITELAPIAPGGPNDDVGRRRLDSLARVRDHDINGRGGRPRSGRLLDLQLENDPLAPLFHEHEILGIVSECLQLVAAAAGRQGGPSPADFDSILQGEARAALACEFS